MRPKRAIDNLQEKSYYVDGILNDTSEVWLSNGKQFISENYVNGKLEGWHREWHDTRSDETEGSNEQLWKQIEYKNGFKKGSCDIWYDDGKLIYRCYYKNDEPLKVYKCY